MSQTWKFHLLESQEIVSRPIQGDISFEQCSPIAPASEPRKDEPSSLSPSERSRKYLEGKSRPYVDKDTLDKLTKRFPGHSVSEAIQSLLAQDSNSASASPKRLPAHKDKGNSILLLEASALKKLEPFLFCPKHQCPLSSELSQSQGIAIMKLNCPKGCSRFAWKSSSEKENRKVREESPFTAVNQLIFAAVSENLGYECFKRFCNALSLEPVSETLFYASSKNFLEMITQIAPGHFQQVRKFIEHIGDLLNSLLQDRR